MDHSPAAAAFDIDGTLAESKQPFGADMAALLLQLAHKMPVAVMSGASFTQFTEQFLPAFPSDADFSNLYLFPTSAGSCYQFKNGAWGPLYDMVFTPQEKEKIFETLDQALLGMKTLKTPERMWGQQIEDRGAQISFSPLGQKAPLAAKKEWHAAHDAERMILRDHLAKKLPECSVTAGGETTIDITRKGITKAYGLEKFSELIGSPISSIVYVGDALEDGGNDAVVKETDVQTHVVKGPEDTAEFIKKLLIAGGRELRI